MPLYTANPGYSLIVRDATYKMIGNREVLDKPVLKIDFGTFGGSTVASDDGDVPVSGYDGKRVLVAEISGGLIDTDEMAMEQHWSPEDKAQIEATLLDAVTNRHAPAYGDIKRYEPPKVEAPWPAYDNQTPAEILATASATGFVSEAFQYEALTQKRESIMGELEGLLRQDEELTAA